MLSINPNLSTNATNQAKASGPKKSDFNEILKQESEFINFSDNELRSAQKNYSFGSDRTLENTKNSLLLLMKKLKK